MLELWLLDLITTGDTRYDIRWFPTKPGSVKLWLRWNLMEGGD